MKNISRIKELVEKLNKASTAYYKYNNTIMTDKEFDSLYNELELLEKETGIILNNSPTQNIVDEVLPELKKVTHTRPMLSSNKTKDISEIIKFVSKKPCVMSWKEDGLTIVVRYKNGKFIQAITRGQGGLIGEDVTHTMKMCSDIPMTLPYNIDLQVRGECIISYEEFNRINTNLEKPYKNPRNLASGTVRQLNSNIARERKLSYKVFELDQDDYYNDKSMWKQIMTVKESFDYLSECGFNVVEHVLVNKENVEQMIKKFIPENYGFPVDGLIFKYNDVIYGKSLGTTAKFPLDMIALKWQDDTTETQLKYIDWTMGKFGTLTPTAIFKPVEIDGTTVERASLHNISVMKSLGIKAIGQTIYVYKSNMIIPQIDSADDIDKKDQLIPTTCPICHQPTKVVKENNSEVLMCTNNRCQGRLLGYLTHAVSKDALNIDGLSEATLKKFIQLGYLKSLQDIYVLDLLIDESQIQSLDGFGKKSINKLFLAIKKSRHTTLSRFIYSLSIPLVGKTASRAIAKACNDDFTTFVSMIENKGKNAFTSIDGIGNELSKSLMEFWDEHGTEVIMLSDEFIFEKQKENKIVDTLKGKTFCITGKLISYSNRNELVQEIENNGGKVVSSVTSKTDYLINNDTESVSSKNKSAKKLGIPIISEIKFKQMLKGECNNDSYSEN